MKKRLISVFVTLLCVMLSALGLAACDGGKVTVNAPAPKTEVTAEQWAQIMESADNFTITNFIDEYSVTTKIDGTTISQRETMGAIEDIFVVEGEKYYSYHNGDGSWKKCSITEQVYNNSAVSAQILFYFKDDFASFTYADGKYTASSLDKTSTINCVVKNVEITFENGALAGIKFLADFGGCPYSFEIKDFAATVITLPADYTDSTGSSQNG